MQNIFPTTTSILAGKGPKTYMPGGAKFGSVRVTEHPPLFQQALVFPYYRSYLFCNCIYSNMTTLEGNSLYIKQQISVLHIVLTSLFSHISCIVLMARLTVVTFCIVFTCDGLRW